MKLRVDGRLARVYFWMLGEHDRRRVREQGTSLCHLIGVVFFMIPLYLGILAVLGGMFVVLVIQNLLVTSVVVGTIAVIILIGIGISILYKTESSQALRTWVGAKKQGICPHIEFIWKIIVLTIAALTVGSLVSAEPVGTQSIREWYSTGQMFRTGMVSGAMGVLNIVGQVACKEPPTVGIVTTALEVRYLNGVFKPTDPYLGAILIILKEHQCQVTE